VVVRISQWAKFCLCLLPLLLLRLPLHPDFPTVDLDPSWKMALNYAFEKGLQWGSDFGFTYGPFGFIATNFYYPATHSLQVFLVFIILLVFTLYTYQRLSLSFSNNRASWLIPFYFIFVTLLSCYIIDILCFLFVLQVTLFEFFLNDKDGKKNSGDKIIGHLVFATLGLIGQIKFSYFPLALVALFGLSVNFWLKKKEIYKPILTFLASYFLFWILGGQSLSNLGSFFRVSFEISKGYGEAMGVDGKPEVLYAYLICLSVFLFFSFFRLKSRTRWIALVTFAIQFLFVTKAGFVRADVHVFVASVTLGLMLCCLSLLYFDRKKIALLLAILGLLLCQITIRKESAINISDVFVTELLKIPSSLADLFKAHNFEQDFKSSLQEIKDKFPLPELKGGVDIYPVQVSIPLAHNFELRSRPIFQSYTVYTKNLIVMNDEFLRSERAPENIIFDVSPTDGRYPSLDDSLSWREILHLYSLSGDSAAGLILSRTKTNLQRAPPTIQAPWPETAFELNMPVLLPDHEGEVWAHIEFQPSIAGKVLGLLYKWPTIRIEVELMSGEKKTFRIVPGPARAGFLLSPLVENKEDFAALYSHENHKKVKSFTILVDSKDASFFSSGKLSLSPANKN